MTLGPKNVPDDGRDNQHQTNHDTGKVRTQDGVNDDKHVFVSKFSETEVDTGREEEDEHLEIKEE